MAQLVYDLSALKRDLTNLFRLPIGDRLALNQFYLEAQTVVRRARDANLALPPVVTDWLAQADARAKDPLLATTQNAALVAWLQAQPG
ncbi:MAG: hypothetical protein MUC96_02555 [Myxococcaceae bacterium]|jgi:hypothetical protein|nr:hypothetical protein [Myxococcaceae bacterium]